MMKRTISLFECIAAAALVLWFCVFRHPVNNGPFLPVLLILAIASIRIRAGRFALGLGHPPSWRKTLAVAFGAAVLIVLTAAFANPLLAALGLPKAVAVPSMFGPLRGNYANALSALAIVWTFAAFGEEIIYRRYLLDRIATVLGESSAAWWVAVFLSAMVFALGHYYQGPGGMVMRFADGAILGGAFLLSGRNLWAPVIAHGAVNTLGIAMVTFGASG